MTLCSPEWGSVLIIDRRVLVVIVVKVKVEGVYSSWLVIEKLLRMGRSGQ